MEPMEAEFGQERVRLGRSEAQARACGPTDCSLMIGGPMLVLFEIEPNDAYARARDAARAGDLDSTAQWVVYKHGDDLRVENLSVALEIEWPTVDARLTLFFALSEWQQALQILATQDVCFMYQKGEGPLEALGVQIFNGALVGTLDAAA